MLFGAHGEAFFLDLYPGLELLGHSIYVCSSLVENAKPFPITFPPAMYETLVAHIIVNMIDVDVSWHHIFILICIFMMAYDAEDFVISILTFGYTP